MARDLPEDLDLLLALDVLLRERHVTRAARRLGITQSAASQRLSRLREFFGDPLLVAGRPLLSVTPRGQAIEAPLSHALAELRAAVRSGAPFDAATSTRTFVVLGNDLVEALALPALLPKLATKAPGVTLHVERAEADFAERLGRGTADLAFVPEFLAPPSLRRLAVPPEPFVVLARKGHPLGQGPLTLPRYLTARHLLIAPRGAPGSIVDQLLERLGAHRRVAARVQHFSAAPYVIAGTDLIVTCPGSMRSLAAPFGLTVKSPPLELAEDRSVAVWHDRVHQDPGHVWLRESIRGALG